MIAMKELDVLDAEAVGFDPMDLVKALPGEHQQTGQTHNKQAEGKKPNATPSAVSDKKAETASASSGLAWKIGGGAAAALLLLHIIKR